MKDGEMDGAYHTYVGGKMCWENLKGTNHLGTWMTNIKMDVKMRDWVPRSDLMQGWDRWLVVVNTSLKPEVPQNVANLSTTLETIRFSNRTLQHPLSIKHDLYHSR